MLNPPVPDSRTDLSRHLPALDGIRGLAILLVTAYRFNIGPDYDRFPGSLLFRVLHHGDVGVDLFFVLSGFLITGILYDAKGKDRYFRNFYARRGLRIFPLYYGFLFATLVLAPALFGTRGSLFPEAESNQAWLWLYGANFLVGIRGQWCLGSFDHFWSLSIEEQFYLFWPLVIFFCSRRQAMFASLFAVAFSALGRILWIRFGGNGPAMETFTFFRLDGLALGGFLALAARGPSGIKPLVPWALVAVVPCVAGVLAIWQSSHPRLYGIPLFLLACSFAALLVLAVTSRPTTWWGTLWRAKSLCFFGKYSYAMYVFQLPLIRVLDPVLTPEGLSLQLASVFWGRVTYIALMMAITTLLALVSWSLYEKHFLALKSRFETTTRDVRLIPANRGSAQAAP
jgi:peptidoglycan/LPS O-acetylase OafA/YrhL